MIRIFMNVIENLKHIWLPVVVLILIIKLLSFMRERRKARQNEGELAMEAELSKLWFFRYRKLHDIMLKNRDMTSQIDHVVVSRYGIFVIETKDFRGTVYGKEWDKNWTQKTPARQLVFQNPIHQNYGHLKAVERLVEEYDLPIISIVAFSDKGKLNINVKDNYVVYIDEVNDIIKKYKKKHITRKESKKIYKLLKRKNINNFLTRRRHIRMIGKKVKREKRDISKNICPRCGGELLLKKSKMGNFIGCSNYPTCKFRDAYRK